MDLEILHNVEKATRALLEAPYDITGLAREQGKQRPLEEATAEQVELYRQYAHDLRGVYQSAQEYWESYVGGHQSKGHSREEAVRAAYDEQPAGPASMPEAVWFFRRYWLLFDDVNRRLPTEERVPPQFALLGWLVEEGRTEFVRLVTCMPYWPIGLDENGEWC